MRREFRTLGLGLACAAVLSTITFRAIGRHKRPAERRIAPVTRDLHALLRTADATRIYAGPMYPLTARGSGLLASLSAPETRQSVQALEILEDPPQTGPYPIATSCLCDGTHEIQFFKARRMLASFRFKHGYKLDCDPTPDGVTKRLPELWENDKELSRRSRSYVAGVLGLPNSSSGSQ